MPRIAPREPPSKDNAHSVFSEMRREDNCAFSLSIPKQKKVTKVIQIIYTSSSWVKKGRDKNQEKGAGIEFIVQQVCDNEISGPREQVE